MEVSLPSLKAYPPAVSGIGIAKVKLDMVPPLIVLWRKQDTQLVARASLEVHRPRRVSGVSHMRLGETTRN